MRILFVTPYVPSVIRVRPFGFIKGLVQRGAAITLLALAPGDEARTAGDVAGLCERIEIVPHSTRTALLGAAHSLYQSVPLQAAYGRSREMEARLRALLAHGHFDIVHIEHLRGSLYGELVADLPKVYDSVDCISLLFRRAAQSSPSLSTRLMARLDLPRTEAYEGRLGMRYDRVVISAQEDKRALDALFAKAKAPVPPDHVVVIPNLTDANYFQPLMEPREEETLIFSGKMSYHANAATVLYLCEKIMPLIWRQRPGVKLLLVGKDPPPEVRALAGERVTVTGTVPDLRPYLARATVSVSPMRYSVGIQNKVLEAMAMGTPVVTSAQAAQALGAEVGRELLAAGDDPEDFARQVLELLDDAATRAELGARGRLYIEAHHSCEAVAGRLEQVYAQVLAGRGALG